MGRVCIGQGPEPYSLVRLDQVDRAPIGQLRNGKLGHLAQRRSMVERRRQELTRSRQEREVTLGNLGLITCSPFPRQQAVAFRLCALALGDVGKHSERPNDFALRIRQRAGPPEG